MQVKIPIAKQTLLHPIVHRLVIQPNILESLAISLNVNNQESPYLGERYDLITQMRVPEVLESVKGMYALATGREHNLL
jgi:hypothetical protein